MATNSSATDQYEKQIDSLLAVLDNSSSSGDEESLTDLTGSANSSKSKVEANRLDRWRLLEVEMKLLKDHYFTNMKEKNVIIEEKNRIIEERKCFMNEKNHMFEEKCRMMKEMESEMRNNKLLKCQLEEAMEQNKVLTEELDQLKKEQITNCKDKKRFEKELKKVKKQLEEQSNCTEDDIKERDAFIGELMLKMNEKEKSLKHQLEEAIKQNKKLNEVQDQMKQEQADNEKRLEKELSEIKAQLEEQVELVKEKDFEIEMKKQLLEEKNRMLEKMRDNNELKKAIEEKDLFEKVQAEDRKRFEKKLSETKKKLDEQVKLINEKDDQVKNLKQQLEQLQFCNKNQKPMSVLPSTNVYPKKVWFWHDEKPLGILFTVLPGGGVCLSTVLPGSRAASAGLLVGERLLEIGNVDLRNATIDMAMAAIKQRRSYFQMIVDEPVAIKYV